MAILYGMRLASDKNVRHLIVESDSELAIKLISEGCEVMLGEGEGWFLIFWTLLHSVKAAVFNMLMGSFITWQKWVSK